MKMRGFMCQSPADVCMSGDPRSVIVPRQPDTAKYTRLVETRRFGDLANKRSSASVPHFRPTSVIRSSDHVFQVVVMRVSLHCQGCAGKVKKHISKMEGVTSYSIDLETKRVTVMGHVSPVGVLESISKVKRAEFWPH